MTAQRKFTSDPVNSTFRWVFHFTPGMGNVRTMDGYSKGVGPEHSNNHVLLIKKLQNPVLNKFKMCDKIEIFRNEFGRPKDQHEIVLELYPHEFVLHGEYQIDPYIKEFLTAFYTEYLETGQISPNPTPKLPVTATDLKSELTHYTKFKTHYELLRFCQRNQQKWGVGFMKAWYWKHLEVQPELKQTAAAFSFKRGTLEVNHV